MKRLFMLLVALTLVFTLASCKSEKPGPEPQNSTAREAVVDDLTGTVTATSDAEAALAFKGLALKRKDLLDTAVESWAILEFNEGQFVMMEENTSVEISELTEGVKRSETSLEGGKLWIFISNQLSGDESFEIKTPTCALNVRGTVFSISCDPEGGGRLAVYEGTVSLRAGAENYEVTNGAAEIIAENGVLKEVRLVDLDENDAAPFFIKGAAGPGGALETLRERLPRLTWDEEHPPVFGAGAEVATEDPDAAEDPLDVSPANGVAGQDGARTSTPGQTASRTGEPPTATMPTQSTTTTTTTSTTGQTPGTTTTTTSTTGQTPGATTTTPAPTPTPPGTSAVAPGIAMTQSEYKVTAGSSLSAGYTLTGSDPITVGLSAPAALGLKINPTSKTITGTSLPAGSYQATVTATNSAGSSSTTFAVLVSGTTQPEVKETPPAPVAPVVEAPTISFKSSSYSIQLGEPLTLTYGIAGSEPIQVSLNVANLRGGPVAGFNLNTSARTISVGPEASVGEYTVTLTATNSAGSATASAGVSIAATAGKDPTYGVTTEPEPEPDPDPVKGLRPGSGKEPKGEAPELTGH